MKSSIFVAALCAGSSVASIAVAAPVYTTSVTVPYDPQAESFGPPDYNYARASNNSSYTVRTAIDTSNFYVDVTSTPNPNTNTTLQFANVYVGGINFNTGLIFEVTNNRVSTTDDPGTYYSLAGTGFTFNAVPNDISFALPLSFLETNPLNIAGFNTQSPGNQVRVSYTQAFGYPLVFGGYFDPVNRLGAQIIPASDGAVPEPASWALMLAGLGVIGVTMRRKQRASVTFA